MERRRKEKMEMRFCCKSRIQLFLLSIILLILLPQTSILANGGPLYYSAKGSGSLQFDSHSNISLVREKVTYSIIDENSRGEAWVTVEYQLTNKSDHNNSIEMMFLTLSSNFLRVVSNSEIIPVSLISDVQITNWKPREKTEVVEPVSGEILKIPRRGYIDPVGQTFPMYGSSFELDFQPNETKEVTISYFDNRGVYDKNLINKVFSYLYYLTPAAAWEGEPRVELVIELPSSDYQVSSNLLLDQIDSKTYTAHFDRLPDQEWYFSIVNTKGLIFSTNTQTSHNLYASIVIALMIFFLYWTAKHFKKIYIFTLGSPVVLGSMLYFVRKIGEYPLYIVFTAFYYLLVICILLICFLKLKKRINMMNKIGGENE